jgi:transposase InsO family protein
LDLLHYVVFGLIKVPLISKSLYYVSFIDDYSIRTWVYFLRTKYEVFSQFKELKSLLEYQVGRNIKVLRTDNGSEFCSAEFDKSCKENDVERHNTNPYTPE